MPINMRNQDNIRSGTLAEPEMQRYNLVNQTQEFKCKALTNEFINSKTNFFPPAVKQQGHTRQLHQLT